MEVVRRTSPIAPNLMIRIRVFTADNGHSPGTSSPPPCGNGKACLPGSGGNPT